jgi:hypothetical protein
MTSNDRHRLPITGMTCSHCETTVSETLQAFVAQDVQADFTQGDATFPLPRAPVMPGCRVQDNRDRHTTWSSTPLLRLWRPLRPWSAGIHGAG